MTYSSNGQQQRPSNPHRFAIWPAKPFRDGRPPASDFSINMFLPLDVIRQLYDAIASGVIQLEQDRNGVPGVTLWGNGYRGTGAPTQSGGTSPIVSGTFNTHKALYQQQQAPLQGCGQPPAQPPQQYQPAPQQYQPAPQPQYAPQQAPAPAQGFPPAAAPAPAPQPAPAPAPPASAPAPSGWGQQGGGWAQQPPAGF